MMEQLLLLCLWPKSAHLFAPTPSLHPAAVSTPAADTPSRSFSRVAFVLPSCRAVGHPSLPLASQRVPDATPNLSRTPMPMDDRPTPIPCPLCLTLVCALLQVLCFQKSRRRLPAFGGTSDSARAACEYLTQSNIKGWGRERDQAEGKGRGSGREDGAWPCTHHCACRTVGHC